MFTAGRLKVHSKFYPASSQYGAHMGSCQHIPAYAEAWLDGRRERAVIVECGDMEPEQAVAKAVALVR